MILTAALWLEGKRGNVKAGEYLFKQASSLRDVMDMLVAGKQVLHADHHSGRADHEQIVERLRENDVLTGDAHGRRRAKAR